jgi:putative sigma-54 modulation protein
MNVQITAKNLELTNALKDYVEKKLAKIEKYFDYVLDISVVLEVQKNVHTAEILVNAKGVFLKGLERSEDLYASIDLAVDKIERQLSKYKEKLKEKIPNELTTAGTFKLNIFETESFDEDTPKIIISKEMPAKPMNIEEAVMQMNLLNKNFFVFKNAQTNDVNVVYKRDDGNIGLIQP